MADEQFTRMRDRLMALTALQRTPIEYSPDDYDLLIVDGIRALYVDLNKSAQYRTEFDEQSLSFIDKELLISEEEYILPEVDFRSSTSFDVDTIIWDINQ